MSKEPDPPVNTTDDPDPFISGWVSQLNNRGTIDIIWTCLFTVFLCSWTLLCLNIPSKSDTKTTIFLRKLRWMNHAILGPEFVLGAAAGQYESAHRGVQGFKKLGHPNWTMRHAFFADMGGIVLHPRDSTPFPVNNKHLIWLVENGYTPLPLIDEREIWDRSKADMLVKLLNFCQIAYLLISVAARRIQNLAITTIELGAVSNATCSLAILFVWMHKPADVMTSIPLHINSSMAEILVAAGDIAKDPYVMTPLDFVDNMGPSWSANIMAFIHIPAGPRERPLTRFPNDRFPHIRGIRQVILIVVTLFTDAIHLFGWSYRFPTAGEQLAWRIATMIMFVTAAIFWLAEVIAVIKRDRMVELWHCMIFTPKKLPALREERALRPEEPQLTAEDFPETWECGASGSVFTLYLIARAFTIIEMFLGLRKLPQSAFEYVDWTLFLPHY
ncbi:hypothetical protein F5883DRAFT_607898 [Diaporthe sp. PMI_573]|nr:hypothetical protein F5883DRAFT_607898 [Diaporthaceae sp. PMI_573]